MKVTISGVVHWHKYTWSDKATYELHNTDMSDYGHQFVPIGPASFEFDVPDDFDYISGQIKTMKAEKEKILADAHVKAMNIDAQIQELLCLEHRDFNGGDPA